jgi:outer membrane protein assembly factor BamB
MKNIYLTTALLLGCSIGGVTLADWPQFRGADGTSVLANAKVPTQFGGEAKKNVVWRTSLDGRSVGGAIVVGDQVVTTSSSGMDQRRIQLISLNETNGTVRWTQEFVARGRPYCHPTSANAAPTPVSDGKNIIAFFSSNDMACVDIEGNLVWYRSLSTDFPKAGNDVGMSSSPIIIDGVCVVQVECQGDSFAAGVSCADGTILWKLDRPKKANWSSPTEVKGPQGERSVLIQSGTDLQVLNPKTGTLAWSLPMGCSTIPSTLALGSKLFVPSAGLTLLVPSESGGAPKKLWDNNKLSANACSPVVVGDRVYTISRVVLACADIETGEVKWQSRLPDAKSIWSSPVVAGNHLFVFTEQGKCLVVDLLSEKGEVIESNELGDDVLGTPAISGNAMYVRSVSGVWKIGSK